MADALPPPAETSAPPGKIAGYAIGVCALLTIVAIGLHPVAGAHHAGEVFDTIGRLGPMLRAVHGTVIAFMLALLYGFVVYSLRRGLRREAVVGGLVTYAAGIGAMLAAALIDGFLIPTLGQHYAGSGSEVTRVGIGVLGFCGAAIQVLAKFGVAAISAAIALWSIELARERGVLRTVATLGVVGALIPVGVLLVGGALVPHTLGIIVIAQGIWYLAIATLLVRGEV